MADLKPALLAPITAPQPAVDVGGNAALRARAWAETVRGGNGPCLHVIVLNTANRFESMQAAIAFAAHPLPPALNATLPFEDNGDRLVEVRNGKLADMIAPNSVNVYRIGCAVPAQDALNLSPNAGFEQVSLLGGVTGWSGGRAGWFGTYADGHDRRARLFLDTTRPHTGRYALRVVVPSAAALTMPWAQACVDSYYPTVHRVPECNACSDGMVLPKGTRYTIRLWVRGEHATGGGMRVEVLVGSWKQDKAELTAFNTVGTYERQQTVASATVDGTWRLVSGELAPASTDCALQLRFSGGPGAVLVDDTYIAAHNATVPPRAHATTSPSAAATDAPGVHRRRRQLMTSGRSSDGWCSSRAAAVAFGRARLDRGPYLQSESAPAPESESAP